MSKAEIDWIEIVARISKILEETENLLSAEAIGFVQDYLFHDEYEIAFEGLCLELIEQDLLTTSNIGECLELAQELRLNEESVLKDDFWTRLTAHVVHQ